MKKIFLSILLVFALAACDKQEHEQGRENSQYAISINEVILPPTGGRQTFYVTSDFAWEIELTTTNNSTNNGTRIESEIANMISPSSGNSGTTLVTVNSDGAKDYDIDVLLNFKSNGKTFASIPFKQSKPFWSMTPSSTLKNIGWWDTENIALTIKSNTDWKIKNLPEWLNISDSEYIHSGKPFNTETKIINISPKDYNLDEQDRDDNLIIVSGSGEYPIPISQKHKTLIAKYNGNNTINFGPCNSETNTKTIQVTSAFPSWEISTEEANGKACNWIKEYKKIEGSDNVNITSNANDKREKQIGYIVITAVDPDRENNPPTRKMEVTLEPYILGFNGVNKDRVNEYTLPWDKSNRTTEEISTESSGAWILTKRSGDWFDFTADTKTEGIGIEYGEESSNLYLTTNGDNEGKNLHLSKDRTGEILLTSKEEGVTMTSILPIIQSHYEFSSTLPEELELGTSDTNWRTFRVTCSGDWEITPDQSWLEITPTKGTGGAQDIQIRAKSNNTSTGDREGRITLHSTIHKNLPNKDKYDYKAISCDITQLKYIFEVTPKGKTFTFDALPGSQQQTIKINCSDTWYIEPVGNPSWIMFNNESLSSKKEYNKDIHDLTITVLDNTEMKEREGSFKITSSYNHSETFYIKQGAFVFDTKDESINNMDAIPTSAYSVTLGECMGSWYIVKPEWINVSQSSGSGGNTQITITPTNYITDTPDTDGRTDEVKIISNTNNKAIKTITVHQNAHWLTVSKNSVSISAKQENTQINIECASSWTVKANANWITFDKNGAIGNGYVLIKAAENTTGKERSAEITVASRGEERVITVTQAGK